MPGVIRWNQHIYSRPWTYLSISTVNTNQGKGCGRNQLHHYLAFGLLVHKMGGNTWNFVAFCLFLVPTHLWFVKLQTTDWRGVEETGMAFIPVAPCPRHLILQYQLQVMVWWPPRPISGQDIGPSSLCMHRGQCTTHQTEAKGWQGTKWWSACLARIHPLLLSPTREKQNRAI